MFTQRKIRNLITQSKKRFWQYRFVINMVALFYSDVFFNQITNLFWFQPCVSTGHIPSPVNKRITGVILLWIRTQDPYFALLRSLMVLQILLYNG